MNADRPRLKAQLPLLSRLQTNCLHYRQVFGQIHDQLKRLSESGIEARQKLLREHETARKMLEERVSGEYQSRCSQIRDFAVSQTQAIQQGLDHSLSELSGRFEDLQRQQQAALENELWVLQSVCDENGVDTPVSNYERAEASFENQQKGAIDVINTLNRRVEETEAWLAKCHTSADSLLPTPSIQLGTPEVNRQYIADETAAALELSDSIFRQHLPQWVLGWRPVWISLLLIPVIAIPITAVRADLQSFLNPELRAPDWNWLMVSSLISAGAVVLLFTVILLIAQQKLRRRFDQMLQAAANAQFAFSTWNAQSVRDLNKLKVVAKKWQKQMARLREQKTELLEGGASAQMGTLQQQHEVSLVAVKQHHETLLTEASSREQFDLQAMANWRKTESARLRDLMGAELQQNLNRLEANIREQTGLLNAHREQLLKHWNSELSYARTLCSESRESVAETSLWPVLTDGKWTPPETLPAALPAGELKISLPVLPGSGDGENRDSIQLTASAVLRFPADTSVVIEHDVAGREPALEYVRAILLKLLTSIPPGRLQFTLIDPVGLGQSFSALMHLADFDELLIGSRIWTESIQIRDRLQKVTEHMENVFQTYLRSEFETIEQYNASAGEVAEPWHFVIVAGFPTAFSEEAARHLAAIMTSGPRCGVHAIVTCNPQSPMPRSFDPKILQTECLRFHVADGRVLPLTEEPLTVDFTSLPSPAPAEYVSLVRAVGEKSKDARRVEVSFTRISPKPAELWTHSTADGIDLPIGRAGASRLQYLRLGRGTSQHVLIAGKTGSGKSTLLHILITNLALHYGPREIQFFLIDFKKGVEFRTYAANQLPHAKVVAIESDREFGLSVLERLDEVLQERGETFRTRGVQDLPAFRQAYPGELMPRVLLLIDEFQEFFVAEDRVSSRASLLLDRLIRQGRAFGIHVVLGSQTLGGAYSLARSTLGQIAVRVALQCSESDAHLILSEENSAARLLTRPGEAIYNDANGMVEGNHPFQIAWLNERRREQAIHEMLAYQRNSGSQQSDNTDQRMIVFEGTVAPSADLCGPLNAWLKSENDATRRIAEYLPVWVGEPVAIAPPACIELRRAAGQNILIVGQETDMADSILLMAALSCFHPAVMSDGHLSEASEQGQTPLSPQFILLNDFRDREASLRFSSAFANAIPGRFRSRGVADTDAVIADLHGQLLKREGSPSEGEQPETLLAIRNIGQFRSLKRDDDEFSFGGFGETKAAATTASMLTDLIKRGPLVGLHVIIWSDTFNNATRWLSASLLREFENRIAFRMNQTDSASLVDTPVAASLVSGRAVLYRDQTGVAEKFRPFAWPSSKWLASALPRPVMELEEFDAMDIDSLMIE